MSQHCAYYQSVSSHILNLICIHLTREHMNGNCESNCWFMGSSWFVTVCASLRRLLPVCDSLRQFVTAGASQTVCDCHIANPATNTTQLSTSIDWLQQRWHTVGISDVFHSFLHDDVAELAGHPEGQHPQTVFFTFTTHLLLGFGRLKIQGRMMMCSIWVLRLCLVLSQYNGMNMYRFRRA